MRLPGFVVRPLLAAVFRAMGSRPPDFIVGGEERPYLRRWHVFPRNRWFNLYLHEFLRSDDDVALHDHMYVNASVVLAGGYVEELEGRLLHRPPGALVFRRPSTPHRVLLIPQAHVGLRRSVADNPIRLALAAEKNFERLAPAISVFVCGPRVREWGFWCAKGWRPWTEVVEQTAKGNVHGGRRC